MPDTPDTDPVDPDALEYDDSEEGASDGVPVVSVDGSEDQR